MNEGSSVSELYQLFSKKSELLHRFAEKLDCYSDTPRDYGSGVTITMAEIHTLTAIAERPGITVTELAEEKVKTPSAVSQLIKKLEKKELVFRRPHAEHGKKICFFVTPEGQRLSDLHKSYDVQVMNQTLSTLLQTCTMADIDAFFRVVEQYCTTVELK